MIKLQLFTGQNLILQSWSSFMQKKDAAILSTFVETFKSFQLNQIIQPSLKYDPTATVVLTDLDEVFFNSVCIKQPLDDDKLIEELQDIQRTLNKPLTIWITPETQGQEFEKKLKEQFESPGAFYGMLLDLKSANLSPTAQNITIKSVESHNDANTFARIYCNTFHFPGLLEHIEKWAITQYEMDNPTCINYIAKVDGVDAGVSTLVIDRNFSEFRAGGFYNACVLPLYRKSGVATAMACHRIEVSKTIGLDYLSIILMSDAMARGYCTKLGFKDCKRLTPYFIPRKTA